MAAADDEHVEAQWMKKDHQLFVSSELKKTQRPHRKEKLKENENLKR